jgi:hypothetical protein
MNYRQKNIRGVIDMAECPLCTVELTDDNAEYFLNFHDYVCASCAERLRMDDDYYEYVERVLFGGVDE